MKREHTVSLCLIVKNEEKTLKRCLQSVVDLVDEIIVVDTGSEDESVNIAKEFGAKIGTFKWNQNFSEARNYAISLATKEWIFFIDADEYLRREDSVKLIQAFNDFSYDSYVVKVLSLNTVDDYQNLLMNLNHRIFKNHKGFYYSGPIHEQLQCENNIEQQDNFKIIDVGFYHTGYIREVVNEKHKTDRNLEILTKLAKKDPTNDYNLFNLATEYSQMNQIQEALELYDTVYRHANFSLGFMPKLVIFRIQCLVNLDKLEEALEAIEEGLTIYPDYTELVYYRASIELSLGLVLKAVESFKKCLEMGKPRVEIEFQPLCYGFGPHYELAKVYEEQKEYIKAIDHYNQCLLLNPSKFQLLYAILRCLKGLKQSSEIIIQTLQKCFNLNEILNQIIFIDLLIYGGYYNEAKQFLQHFTELKTNRYLILQNAKIEFYLKQYSEAKTLFLSYSNFFHTDDVEVYLYIIHLVTQAELTINWSDFFQKVELFLFENEDFYLVDSETDLSKLCLLLKHLYLIQEVELFSKLSKIACESISPTINFQLVQLFDEIGEYNLVKHIIINEIKVTGTCSKEKLLILCRLT